MTRIAVEKSPRFWITLLGSIVLFIVGISLKSSNNTLGWIIEGLAVVGGMIGARLVRSDPRIRDEPLQYVTSQYVTS